MKAEIMNDGCIWVIAEDPAEAYALKYLIGEEPCSECGQVKIPIVFDMGVATPITLEDAICE